jgi:UDP-N-acetylmuramoyl-tripeptide--D-alanyl-D-alanine ligase
MKNLFKKIISNVLALEARLLLWRKKPEVIAITGSAGKTSTKEFLKTLLEIDFDVLAPEEGYNTELGAPLALFSEKAPKSSTSIVGWFVIIVKLFFKALFIKRYPQKVIVEMGADSPGDIKYLAQIFKPQKGIILTVLPTHLAEFKTEIGVAAEKSELAKAIGESGQLFLNSDDSKVKPMATLTKGQVVMFGTKGDEPSGYFAHELKSDLKGTEFNLHHLGKSEKYAARIYGRHMIYPLLAAIAVAREEGIALRKIKDELREIVPFKGRMNLIEGMNDSVIIDDSYNANPKSVAEALEFLGSQKGRRIAVLGSMNELGDASPDAHSEVGRLAAKKSDLIITVGEEAGKYLAPAAQAEGLKISQVRPFKTPVEAGEFLQKVIESGDIILVKGSQNNVRTEKTVELIMKEPIERKKLLVRQSDFWQDN